MLNSIATYYFYVLLLVYLKCRPVSPELSLLIFRRRMERRLEFERLIGRKQSALEASLGRRSLSRFSGIAMQLYIVCSCKAFFSSMPCLLSSSMRTEDRKEAWCSMGRRRGRGSAAAAARMVAATRHLSVRRLVTTTTPSLDRSGSSSRFPTNHHQPTPYRESD